MLGKGFRYYSSIIRDQKRPFRFLASQILRQTGLCKFITIKTRLYRIKFHPSAFSAVLWTDPNNYDRDEQFLMSYLREGDVVVDIGANIGTISLAAASLVGEKGSVFAVEAHPKVFGYLQQNVNINPFKNVKVYNFAVGHEEGKISFSNKRADDTNAIVDSSDLEIPLTTLDILISPLVDHVDLLKIDVEGYERFVCQGAVELLKKTDTIYIESFEENFQRYGYSTQDLIGILKSFGFEVVRQSSSGFIPVSEDYVSIVCENLIAVKRMEMLNDRVQPGDEKNIASASR